MSRDCSQRSLKKLRRICDVLDRNPAAWTVYSETFKMGIEDMIEAIQEFETKIAVYSGHRPTNRFGNPMTRRGRDMGCKSKTWANRPHICEQCGLNLTWNVARVHHIVPVSQGGTDKPENLLLLCANCHAMAHGPANR